MAKHTNELEQMTTNGLTENRYNVIIKMLNDITKREGIVNPRIELLKGSEKGDGYVGEKTLAILKGENKTIELFVKGAPTNQAFKKAFDPRPIYLMEILLYTEIMPTFFKFQLEKNIERPFTSVIQCVDTCVEMDNELLILQNARNLGFELWNRMKQMNKEHVEFVFTEYGKFHGISYALKDQRPETYQGLIDKFPLVALELMAEKMSEGLVKMNEKAKTLFDPIKESDIYNVYSAYVDYLPDFMKNLAQTKDKYSVIIHGDCWSNNMMFKYKPNTDKTCPEKMCLIDFQIVGESSPVLDLSYFMYASSPKDVYGNLDHYLRVYHQSLRKTIQDLGSNSEDLLPFDELKHQWKLYSKFGLAMAAIVLKICIQDKEETMEFSEVMEIHGETDMTAGFSKDSKNDHLYHERLKALIEYMVENQYI